MVQSLRSLVQIVFIYIFITKYIMSITICKKFNSFISECLTILYVIKNGLRKIV